MRLRSTFAIAFVLIAAWLLAIHPAHEAVAGGGGCHRGSAVRDAATTTVRLTEFCFSPTVARVERGATLTFVNDDVAPHTVTGAAMSWGHTENLMLGDTLEATFTDEGVYPYACILHPGMVGAIVVGDGCGRSRGSGRSRQRDHARFGDEVCHGGG